MENSVAEGRAPDGMTADVVRERLPNGLTLLIKENHSAPVVAILVLVRVGYFHEPDRVNGIAHVIEHMMFKGTPLRPEVEQFAREIRELGGVLNASTSYEETSYYVVVPSRHLERALDIQADAVQHARMDPGDLAKEIEVIVQESLQKRDNPPAVLVEALYALSHDVHRIRRWRIGHPETLRAMTREDLTRFVEDTYRPENMILAIVGDLNTHEAHTLARRYWGEMLRGALRREESPVEPPRLGFRYRRMTGDTRQRLLMFAFPAPSTLHEDAAPLLILSAILSDGRSARLYRRLREELRIANSAWASYDGYERMGLFTLGAESIEADPLPVERALWAEILRVQREPVGEEELKRVKRRVESRRLYAQEEVLGVARSLAGYEALGDYHLADTLMERLHAVSAADVLRVANAYLQISVGALLEYLPAADRPPTPSTAQVEAALLSLQAGEPKLPAEAVVEPATPGATPTFHPMRRTGETEARRLEIPGGGTLLFKARRDLPLVSITTLFHGGRRGETRANCGITNLMLKSTLKGTRSYGAEEIANRIEGLGSGIGLSVTADYFGYGMKIKRDALEEGFAVFAEVLAHPTFPAEEMEREKQAIYAEIRRQQDNNSLLALDLFAAACYGEDHPYGLPTSGILEAIQPIMRTDLRIWQQRHVIADNLVVGLVGDLEEEEAVALFANLLGHRSCGRTETLPLQEHGQLSTRERVLSRQKQQTAAALGFPGASLANPDRYALDVLAEIASGMGGRFFRAVRGEHALAYQVAAFHRARQEAGNFITYTSTSPENELRARELLLRECAQFAREPVTAAELAAAKATILGEHVIGTQTFSAQSGELATVGVFGMPIDEPQRYLARIAGVTAEGVMDVARRYLDPATSWLGVVRGGAGAS